MKNILLNSFDTPHNVAPFDQIQLENYKPAIEKGIAEAKRGIDAITNQTEVASFENTIEALEFNGMHLDRVTSIFFNLNSAETSPEMQQLAQEISPMLSSFSNDINLNEQLFERIKTVVETVDQASLTPEQ
jgi:Zn-dependent oligopeptidase